MAFFFKKKKKKRCCVVGLDGVPFTLLEALTRNGVMPFMEKLKRDGNLRSMKVTLPEISAVSWSSFMTGTNPGTHGIFGFMDLKPQTYSLTFPSYNDLKAPAIWDNLKEIGKRSVVINQPSTYPARPINGVLISGFVAIDIKKAVYPATLVPQLQELGYKIDIDTMKAREDKDFLIKELYATLAGRSKALDLLWDNEDWDYFEVVVTGTDRLHHYLWDALGDNSHKYHQAFLDYYNKVDSFVESTYKKFLDIAGDGEEGNEFLLLSDHGFTGIEKEINLNCWLAKEGYLSYMKDSPDSVADISDSAKAFVLDPGRIYINYKGKYPKGCVERAEGEGIMREIKEKLEKVEFEGKKVIQNVFRKDEIYSGPYLDRAADMVALSYPGFDLKGSVKKDVIFDKTVLQGMHTWDDAFFWSFGRKKDNLNITDIAQIIIDNFKS
ncbi:MAG: alkaline phosphatase family protein [Candidatus Schekmanbacteria bacterium]|nr:alkaline phosphatase family protein [Candidatus Schekmanbacteria bacterium]